MMKGGLDEEEGPENSLRKLAGTFGVQNYVILNKSGIPIKYHGVDQTEALHQAALLSELTLTTQNFLASSSTMITPPAASERLAASHSGTLDTELVTLRLKSKKCEIIVTVDENYTLIVTHEPNAKELSAASAAPAAGADEAKKGVEKKSDKKGDEESKTTEE